MLLSWAACLRIFERTALKAFWHFGQKVCSFVFASYSFLWTIKTYLEHSFKHTIQFKKHLFLLLLFKTAWYISENGLTYIPPEERQVSSSEDTETVVNVFEAEKQQRGFKVLSTKSQHVVVFVYSFMHLLHCWDIPTMLNNRKLFSHSTIYIGLAMDLHTIANFAKIWKGSLDCITCMLPRANESASMNYLTIKCMNYGQPHIVLRASQVTLNKAKHFDASWLCVVRFVSLHLL